MGQSVYNIVLFITDCRQFFKTHGKLTGFNLSFWIRQSKARVGFEPVTSGLTRQHSTNRAIWAQFHKAFKHKNLFSMHFIPNKNRITEQISM